MRRVLGLIVAAIGSFALFLQGYYVLSRCRQGAGTETVTLIGKIVSPLYRAERPRIVESSQT